MKNWKHCNSFAFLAVLVIAITFVACDNGNNNSTVITQKPIVSIFYGSTEISQNGIMNAGEVIITQSKDITLIIKNTGTETLTIDTANITVTGTDASVFTKTSDPNGSITANNQSSFVIKYTPVKVGEENAVLTIPTNDNSRNPVIVNLKGTGIQAVAVFEMTQNNTLIGNNSLTPFDFGQTNIGSFKDLTFTIKNTGNIPLELTAEPAAVSSNTVFAVQAQPTNKLINPESTTTFTIRYTPTTAGVDSGNIIISNNGVAGINDNTFTLNIKGTGM